MAAAAYAEQREKSIEKDRRRCHKSNEFAHRWGQGERHRIRHGEMASNDICKDFGIVLVVSLLFVI